MAFSVSGKYSLKVVWPFHRLFLCLAFSMAFSVSGLFNGLFCVKGDAKQGYEIKF